MAEQPNSEQLREIAEGLNASHLVAVNVGMGTGDKRLFTWRNREL